MPRINNWPYVEMEGILYNAINTHSTRRFARHLLACNTFYSHPFQLRTAAAYLLGSHWHYDVYLTQRAALGDEQLVLCTDKICGERAGWESASRGRTLGTSEVGLGRGDSEVCFSCWRSLFSYRLGIAPEVRAYSSLA